VEEIKTNLEIEDPATLHQAGKIEGFLLATFATIPVSSIKRILQDPDLLDVWQDLWKLRKCPGTGPCIYDDLLRFMFKDLDNGAIKKFTDKFKSNGLMDDLAVNLKGKKINKSFEDAQGRLVVTTESSTSARTVSTIEKTATGEFKSFKYQNAYNRGTPPVSANGLVPDFSTNPNGTWLYPVTGNQKNIVKIKLTGKRIGTGGDFHKANQAAGFPTNSAPTGYTWHHLDDFDPQTGEATFQLVKTSEHVKTFPHTGSVKQYENYYNTIYN